MKCFNTLVIAKYYLSSFVLFSHLSYSKGNVNEGFAESLAEGPG